uniref:Uncharacterized protein n=1 Tax=Glossina brevipalpis TaxID=37001 RepID=A0A1A9WTJ0_9MUSC
MPSSCTPRVKNLLVIQNNVPTITLREKIETFYFASPFKNTKMQKCKNSTKNLYAPQLFEQRGVLEYPLLPVLLLVIQPVALLCALCCSSLLLFTISIGLLGKFSVFQPFVLKFDKPENEELPPLPAELNLTSTLDGIKFPKNCATLFCGGDILNTFWALDARDVLDILKVQIVGKKTYT